MSHRWLLARRGFFVRDLVRDYCTVYLGIDEQSRLFSRDGLVSYASLRDLLGEVNRKGVFWRLKDTSHHLFRNTVGDTPPPDAILLWQFAGSVHPTGLTMQAPVEALLDWCIGYAFHECVKLREDAFQRQHYASRLAQLSRAPSVTGDLYDPLHELASQTAESSARELQRILYVLRHGLYLLTRYLEGRGGNGHLARWLAVEEDTARRAFGVLFSDLMRALYGDRPQRLYHLAAEKFLEAGRAEEAERLLLRARSLQRLDKDGQELLRSLSERHAEASAADGRPA